MHRHRNRSGCRSEIVSGSLVDPDEIEVEFSGPGLAVVEVMTRVTESVFICETCGITEVIHQYECPS